MSWSISYQSRRDFVEDRRGPGSTTFGDHSSEVEEQIRVARAGVAQIIDSGAVGQDTNVPGGHKDFSINISGHANPGHEKQPGYANDGISISVWQRDAAADLSGTSRADVADQKRAAASEPQGDGSGGLEPGELGEGTDEEFGGVGQAGDDYEARRVE